MSIKEKFNSLIAKINLTSAIILIITFCLCTFGVITSYHSLNLILQQKKRDTWTIYFQELESHALNVSKVIDHRIVKNSRLTPQTRAFKEYFREPQAIFRYKNANKLTTIQGPFEEEVNLKSLGLLSPNLQKHWTFTYTDNGLFVFRNFDKKGMEEDLYKPVDKKGPFLVGWQLPMENILSMKFIKNNNSLIYIVNINGDLVFANNKKLNRENILKRALVRQYITSSFRSGQLEFYDEKSDTEYFGLFLEIPKTNLVIFSESNKEIIFSTVRKLGFHFLMVMCNFLLISIILAYLLLEHILKPLKPLQQAAHDVGQGNFTTTVPTAGFGEFNVLANAFNDMTKRLIIRDNQIKYLAVQEQKKKALKKELEFARTIQSTLLPMVNLPDESGLRVDSCYVPAGSVSGDWYSHFYDERSGDTVIIMIDVSGHGAGSGLLTAMVVGIFETYQRSYNGDPEILLKLINIALFSKSRQEAHASMLLIKYNRDDEKMTLYNMGHQFPFYVDCSSDKLKCKRIKMPSDLGGMNEEGKIYQTQIDFFKNDRIFMFTDGLIEFQGIETKPIKIRDVQKVLVNNKENKKSEIIDFLFKEWKKRLGNNEVPDDLCMLLITAI